MKTIFALVSTTLVFLLPLSAQEPTEAEKERILKNLEELKDVLESGTSTNNIRALSLFQSALSSNKNTLKLYTDAMKEIEFDAKGKEESEWREWKDRNEERISETGFIKALQFQLKYLILSLKATSGKDPDESLKKTMPELMSYMNTLVSEFEDITEHSSVLGGSVLNSLFAKKAKLNVTVDRGRPWVFSAIDTRQIYERSVLPYYRSQNDHSNIQNAWDKRILHEGKLYGVQKGIFSGGSNYRNDRNQRNGRAGERDRERAERKEENRKLDQALNEFKLERLPDLNWGKTRDQMFYGTSKASSLSKMVSHIRDNLDHPRATRWIEELSNFINADIYDAESFYQQKEKEEFGE